VAKLLEHGYKKPLMKEHFQRIAHYHCMLPKPLRFWIRPSLLG
jgi:hypothetical protein